MTGNEEPVDRLQHLVLARLGELGTRGRPMSPRQAAKNARGLISYDTIYTIARGEHSGRIANKTAEGLALALQMPVERVYEAAGAPRPRGRWLLPERFDRLDTAQRRLVEDMASALLIAEERGYERGRRGRE